MAWLNSSTRASLPYHSPFITHICYWSELPETMVLSPNLADCFSGRGCITKARGASIHKRTSKPSVSYWFQNMPRHCTIAFGINGSYQLRNVMDYGAKDRNTFNWPNTILVHCRLASHNQSRSQLFHSYPKCTLAKRRSQGYKNTSINLTRNQALDWFVLHYSKCRACQLLRLSSATLTSRTSRVPWISVWQSDSPVAFITCWILYVVFWK